MSIADRRVISARALLDHMDSRDRTGTELLDLQKALLKLLDYIDEHLDTVGSALRQLEEADTAEPKLDVRQMHPDHPLPGWPEVAQQPSGRPVTQTGRPRTQ